MEDWYHITALDLRRADGSFIITQYGSLQDALNVFLLFCVTDEQDLYPEHEWKPWLFPKTTQRFWECKENQRKFMDWIASESGVDTPAGWASITCLDVQKKKGRSILRQYGDSLQAVLKASSVFSLIIFKREFTQK